MVGAAAFNGSNKILKKLLKKPITSNINFSAIEKKDFAAPSTTAFSQEYTGYTPVMLAVAGGGQNLECV